MSDCECEVACPPGSVCGVWGGCQVCDSKSYAYRRRPALTREVVSTPLRGDEPTTLNRWLFGLFVAVILMGLVSIPLAVITHELAAHGWLDTGRP